ncbi:MAG TPA: alpha/beta fold hydrolase [Actinomycetales bacterium]
MSALAPVTDHSVTLADGRTLLVHECGAPDGVPVVVHHGTPSSGALYGPWGADATARGIRLLSYDRAGYGGSSRHAGRDVAAVASDIATALDQLGIGPFLTWGTSGGGPHALACAALLADRVRATATVAGVAPWDAEGLDPMDGMGEDNIEEFGLALQGEQPLRAWLEGFVGGLRSATPQEMTEQMRTLLSPVDVAALSGAAGTYLQSSMADGLAGGVDGWLDDDLAFVRPWGFELSAVTGPVLVQQGGQDLMVPLAHGPWLAEHLPAATAWIEPDQGHLSLTLDLARVHGWLLEHWH